MTLLQILDCFATCLGVYVLIKLARLANKFWKIKTALSRAFAIDLGAEVIATVVTMAFAVMQFTGYLQDIPAVVQTAMRLIIFTGIWLSSEHLGNKVQEIESGKHRD